MKEVFFIVTVLLSGWGLGWMLAKEQRNAADRGRSINPRMLLISFLAVFAPAIAGVSLSSRSEFLSAQIFAARWSVGFVFAAVCIPLLPALAGHYGGLVFRRTSPQRLFRWSTLKKWMPLLPLVLVWGGLEEIGWRGYLNQNLANMMDPLGASALTGIFWGLWHAPQMYLNPQLRARFKNQVGLAMFLWVAQCVSLGACLGWLQIHTGSFLLPALAHALVNFFGRLSDDGLGPDENFLLSGSSGIFALATTALLAVLLFRI